MFYGRTWLTGGVLPPLGVPLVPLVYCFGSAARRLAGRCLGLPFCRGPFAAVAAILKVAGPGVGLARDADCCADSPGQPVTNLTKAFSFIIGFTVSYPLQWVSWGLASDPGGQL